VDGVQGGVGQVAVGAVGGEREEGEGAGADGGGGDPLGGGGGVHRASPPAVVSTQAPDCQSSSPRARCTDVHRSPYRRPPQPRATGWPVALSVVTDSQ